MLFVEFAAGAELPAGADALAGPDVFDGAEFAVPSGPITICCSAPGAIVACVTGPSVEGVGEAVVSVEDSSALPESTETLPLSAGIEITSADSMKTIAAPIVNFARTEAVPRGEKAVLETLLVNNAPASVFPGCNRTDPTRTMHEVKKIA